MRRILLIDRPVDEAALALAAEVGASEIVVCAEGVAPDGLSGLAMGYHEIGEAEGG